MNGTICALTQHPHQYPLPLTRAIHQIHASHVNNILVHPVCATPTTCAKLIHQFLHHLRTLVFRLIPATHVRANSLVDHARVARMPCVATQLRLQLKTHLAFRPIHVSSVIAISQVAPANVQCWMSAKLHLLRYHRLYVSPMIHVKHATIQHTTDVNAMTTEHVRRVLP